MKILIEESVLRQALKILERHPYSTELQIELAATALRTALDAAEKVEPVAWMYRNPDPIYAGYCPVRFDPPNEYEPADRWVPLYAAPTPPTDTDAPPKVGADRCGVSDV